MMLLPRAVLLDRVDHVEKNTYHYVPPRIQQDRPEITRFAHMHRIRNDLADDRGRREPARNQRGVNRQREGCCAMRTRSPVRRLFALRQATTGAGATV